MLAVAGAAQFMSGPGQSYSVAAYKDPMRSGLGISETDYSLAYGVATLISGLCLPLVGRLVDRFGARRLLPILATMLGAACLWMSHADSLTGLYVGFGMIRSLGQGALTLTAMWIVGEWFAARRGFAASIAGLGGSLSVMCFPLLNSQLIMHFGWQTAWVVLGVAVWAVLIVPAVFVLRDRPEDLGLHPDGMEPEEIRPVTVANQANTDANAGTRSSEFAGEERSWTVGEVLRDLTFWRLLSVPASSGMIITGLTFHQVAMLGSRGVSPPWALGMISVQALIATIASLPAGWLTDRIAGRRLLSLAMLLLAAASGLVLTMPIPHLAVIYAALLGLHGSILRTTGNVIWLNYYGRKHQGGVRGIMMSVMILAAAVGPLPMALSIDHFRSYSIALIAFITIPLAAGMLVWTAKPPRHAD
jgi:MFS family permease